MICGLVLLDKFVSHSKLLKFLLIIGNLHFSNILQKTLIHHSGIANGSLTMFSSQFNNVKKDIILNTCLFWNYIFLLSGMTYYAILGYLSGYHKTPYEINSTINPGIDSPIFLMIQAVTTLFPIPNLFVSILLISLIIVGFNSVLYFIECTIVVCNLIPQKYS